MNANMTIERVDDVRASKAKQDVIFETLAWVQHWIIDVECGLKPTPESLRMVEAKLSSALEAGQ